MFPYHTFPYFYIKKLFSIFRESWVATWLDFTSKIIASISSTAVREDSVAELTGSKLSLLFLLRIIKNILLQIFTHINQTNNCFVNTFLKKSTCFSRRSLLVDHGGRTVRIRPLPIGIPFSRFETMAREAKESSFDKKLKVTWILPFKTLFER